MPRLPDAFEVRLLFGEQFAKKFQWALNIFHEFETGGEREWETGFSQALVYSIHDEYLKVGLEMQFIRRSDAGPQSKPEYEFDIGPCFTWKPSALTRFDIAPLFGITGDYDTAPDISVLCSGVEAGMTELLKLADS